MDVLYLGIFVILSPAFDSRFYPFANVNPTLKREWLNAIYEFRSLLHVFSLRFVTLLDGVPVAHSYIVERTFAEFAAAAVVLAKGIDDCNGDFEGDTKVFDDGITLWGFTSQVGLVIGSYCPRILSYYTRSLGRGHKDFVWRGPHIEIFPRSDDTVHIITGTSVGEMLDHPAHPIYSIDVDTTIAQVGQRRPRGKSVHSDDQSKKRKLQS